MNKGYTNTMYPVTLLNGKYIIEKISYNYSEYSSDYGYGAEPYNIVDGLIKGKMVMFLGREDLAKIWVKYFNKEISNKTSKRMLENII